MKKQVIDKVIAVLFALYLVVLIYILFLYGGRMGNPFELELFSKQHFRMVNCIPFATISTFIKRAYENTINIDIVVRNLAANILMFIPMGMALPVLFEKTFDKFWKFLLFVTALVLIIEIIQFVTFLGSADIDDLILNVLGGSVGYGIVKLKFVQRLLKRTPQE